MVTRLNCEINLSYYISASTTPIGSGQPEWYVTFYNTLNAEVASVPLTDLNEYLATKASTVTRTVTETQSYSVKFLSPALPADTYIVCVEYTPRGTDNFKIFLNPSGKNATTFAVNKVRQAADDRVLDIPSNMPYGNNGIKITFFKR
jgi:hypothetical protein